MRIDLFTLPLVHEEDLQKARSRIRQAAVLLGLSLVEQAHLTTAVTEIARNALMYAGGGTLDILVDEVAHVPLLIARVSDRGEGIVKIDEILAGRYRSRTGMGLGLVGSKRLMDFFRVDSDGESGTTVTLGKALSAGSRPITEAYGSELRSILEQQSPFDTNEDDKLQSQDLLAALAESHTHQEELARVNVELDQTNRGVIALYAELDEKAMTLEKSTERLTLELAERNRLEAQLVQSQKMEAVGQLTGGVAHDFNNILMIILSNIEALQEEENIDPKMMKRLDAIAKATDRATALTRSLLAFSRKLPLQPLPTDINDLVVAAGNLLRPTLGAHIEIDSMLADDPWIVNIDRQQFENALINLCINARDAMPSGGRLLIETSNVVLDDDYATKTADVTAGSYLMVAVTDTGAGIQPEVLGRVFEPFFTTKEVGKGTGLGLSMVHGFVKQSGGHIAVQSEFGTGTVIRMYLPRSAAGHANETATPKPALPRGSERILVAEDDGQVRSAVVQQLQSLGYDVDQAADGASGVAAFECAKLPYDMLLTDVIMPGVLHGKALADAVVKRWPETCVLFMSGYSKATIIHDGRLDPGVHLLTKPFRKIDLAEATRRVLDSRAPDLGDRR